MHGTITTDGTLGIITENNIVSWQYTINGTVITGPILFGWPLPPEGVTDTWAQVMDDVTATETSITTGQHGYLALWVWFYSPYGSGGPSSNSLIYGQPPDQVIGTANTPNILVASRFAAIANPEPTSVVLLLVGVVPLLWRRLCHVQ